MKIVWITGMIVFLTGCVGHQWVKVGATPQEALLAETACKARALKELPPDNIVRDKQTTKNEKYKKNSTRYSTFDANEYQRDILVKDCMYQNGWTQTEVRR
ncbi:hypothetical protein AB4H02_004181 [Salmonella enterica]